MNLSKISWILKKKFSFWQNLTSGKKISFIFLLLLLVSVPLSVFVTMSPVKLRQEAQTTTPQTISQPIRGQPYDFWADIEVGRRDFTEIVPNEIVPNKLFKPEGVVVDRSVSPGRAYVWDAGNSRILGIDLAKCYNSPSPCTADIVIGQPSGNDYGACNQDSSFQTYPKRPPSSASTLCGASEQSLTVLENAFAISMEVDEEGNLFVPDALNNRVLKFIKPFETDTVADEVWGQADFAGNLCNLNGSGVDLFDGPPPTTSSLCYCSKYGCGMGVSLDSQGNLWVADGGNNRVLRFPKDVTGKIDKTADLVLGQPNFNTGSEKPTGSELNQMDSPQSLSLDNNGNLYVADTNNKRILIFKPPFSSGMNPTRIFTAGFTDGPYCVKIDKDPDNPTKQVILTSENVNGITATIKIWELDGSLRKSVSYHNQRSVGSIGIDALGNILNTSYRLSDVFVYNPQASGSSSLTKELFSPPYSYNQVSGKRFGTPAWTGVAAAANQLIVGERRLLFWNNPLSLTNGQPPDGYVGTPSPTELPPEIFGFYQLKADAQNRIWVSRSSEVWVYQAPLTIGAQPIKVIKGSIPVLGGGQITLGEINYDVLGLVPSTDGKFLWLSQDEKNRVLRIRDPLTNPLIDIILGQISLTGTQCNRGVYGEHDSRAELNMLCHPGNLSLDKRGNLFVSDHTIEVKGNNRVLVFPPNLFPDNPPSVIFAPSPIKEFHGTSTESNGEFFEIAFDSTNRMVAGHNPYTQKRFLSYFNDPLKLNSSGNPKDSSYTVPDGLFKDFYGWPIAATFDENDNLFVYDANRGKVMIYKHPFPITPTLIPSLAPSPTLSPTPTLKPANVFVSANSLCLAKQTKILTIFQNSSGSTLSVTETDQQSGVSTEPKQVLPKKIFSTFLSPSWSYLSKGQIKFTLTRPDLPGWTEIRYASYKGVVCRPPTPTTVTLELTADTYISTNQPDTNFGQGNSFKVGLWGVSNYYNGLLGFTLSSLPENATITKATLSLNPSGWGGKGGNVNVYKILKDWSEKDATWNKAYGINNWEVAGCQGLTDIETNKYASFNVVSIRNKVAVNLTSLVQFWKDNPTLNRGLLLKTTTPNTTFFFDSRENSDADKRPKLTITYTLP